ncbi:MAG TPA: NmrA/HSCARG family protein [Thermoanaerobaculia bacterium]|nr:NmrA/HSCARG family protein [Thermoanaerobaculia bacterium]
MTDSNKTVLVTGATGNQGGSVAHELLSGGGYRVRAMTRKPDSEKARALKQAGAEIVAGDLNDEASLRKAMQGAWGVFAVQNTWEAGVEGEEEQGKRQAKVARDAGVQHYVYTSVASADRKTGIPHFENKWRIEGTVRGLGFPSHVILRPVFFMENLLGPWFKPAIDQGQLAMAVKPETRLQMIAVEDIGKYGRWAFDKQETLKGREIDIAGDELTMPETARLLSRASGHPVAFAPPPIEAVRQGSADFAAMLEWFDRVGYDADITANARESGIRPTTFAEWASRQKWS